MVLRYWGVRDVHPEDFASLIDADRRGIPTGVLATAIQRRGWQAFAFRGRGGLARPYLLKGRPLLVLLKDAPGVFHYVVWVGWTPGHVVVHDPSKGPYGLVKEEDFLEAWAVTDYWTLLVQPTQDEAGRPPADATDSIALHISSTCSRGLVVESASLPGETKAYSSGKDEPELSPKNARRQDESRLTAEV